MAEVECEHIRLTLEHTFGNQTAAAELLEMDRNLLRRKMAMVIDDRHVARILVVQRNRLVMFLQTLMQCSGKGKIVRRDRDLLWRGFKQIVERLRVVSPP